MNVSVFKYPLLLGWHKILHLEMFLHHGHVNLALVFAKTFLLHCWLVCQVGKCQGWTCLLVCCHIVCQTSENSGNSGHLGLSIKPTQLISPVCPSLALLGAHTLKVFNKSSRGAIVCRADRFEEGPSKILGSSSRLGIGENQFYEKKKRKIESVLVVLGFPSCKMVVRLR